MLDDVVVLIVVFIVVVLDLIHIRVHVVFRSFIVVVVVGVIVIPVVGRRHCK
jgi:hypothetical protein